MISKQLLIGTQNQSYTVIRSAARKKSLSLKVSSKGEIIVRSPLFVKDKKIHQWLVERSSWIEKQLTQRKKHAQSTSLTYLSNSRHLYLGQHYILKVIDVNVSSDLVKLDEGLLLIEHYSLAENEIKAKLLAWYRFKAIDIFHARLVFLSNLLPWVKNTPPLGIRMMKTRWGSCSSAGKINLNLHLIKAPVECLDYVIIHELCHLVEFNHSPKFYALMSTYNPNWKEQKLKLEALSNILM